MENIETLIVIVSAITLFIYGLQSFSREIENFGEERLSKWIGKLTKWSVGSFALGAVVTGIIQSSTFVSSLTVSLVNSGVISFRDSLLILLGTNVGTTSTAWIVSIQSSFLGPFIIVLGTLISMIPGRVAVAGKSIFYFGFIFFALSLISDAMQPIKDDPILVEVLSKASNPLLGILYGIIITVIIQSSSVVVGLVIVLISQGTIDLSIAIPIVVGANIGTTSTALLVSFKMTPISRLVALSASLFNVIGVLLMFPFFDILEHIAINFSEIPSLQVAMAFTISNTFTSIFFFVFLTPTVRLLQKHRWYREGVRE
ncbi:Na/Pi cotransporter family protein [Parapedobacter sp. SGR-10]|uniref:Na/Pi cotransporter family protein n=1 Tax=Parapedobacter sp. SGR-10 TaxID=2710879 RepID=UPI0013D0A32B|nr:Na/Pi symporter [Parapedobacter sp. SGR-10]NGF57389.1 Na/Pi cotransporter family protein [Parapedobacter sp. SGR-10]